MTKFLLLLALLGLSLASLEGGWTTMNSNSIDSWTQEALIASIQRVQYLYTSRTPVFQSVESVQSQIVAGINYKFVLKFDVGRFEVEVARLLDGSLTIAQTTLLQNLGIAGGWTKLDSNNLDKLAAQASQHAINRVVTLLQKSNGQFSSIESAQSQIVAGTNYKFHLQFFTGSGSRVHFEVTVWSKLDGSFQVTKVLQANDARLGGAITGGWSQLDVQTLDDTAKQAANMAIGHVKGLLKSSNGQFNSIEFAQSQVVAGINYKFHLQFFAGDGGRIHYEVVVWKQLNGTFKVTSALVAN